VSAGGILSGAFMHREPGLKDLLDPMEFRELCESFASHFKVGLRIIDSDKSSVIHIQGPGELCRKIKEVSGGIERCTRIVELIKQVEIEDGAQVVGCFTGCNYQVFPIRYDDRVLGRLVFGPYVPDESAEISDLPPGMPETEILENRTSITMMSDDDAYESSEMIAKVVEAAVFGGYKVMVTSSIHVESLSESYKRLQEKNRELEKMNLKLKELDLLKSNFLATISHELKTPLTSIIGYSEMLLEGLAGGINEEQGTYLSTIMTKSEELLKLIGNILEMAKIESSAVQLELTPSDPGAILENAVDTLRPQARKAGIHLVSKTQIGMPKILVDSDKLRQALVNILSNAVKFTGNDGRIIALADLIEDHSISLKTEAEQIFGAEPRPMIRYTVLDSGIGISRDQLDRIFLSFYQVDGSATRGYGGVGLGLSIARALVEAHGGRILVKSATGRGSQFTVLVPAKVEV